MNHVAKEILNSINENELEAILKKYHFVGSIKLHINGDNKVAQVELNHFSAVNK